MALDLNRALLVGTFVQAAYAPVAAAAGGAFSYTLPAGYQLVDTIFGNDLQTDIGGPKSIVPFGFIARSTIGGAPDFIVAIRGTQSIWEWVQDARFLQITYPFAAGAGQTEDGFTDVYSSLTTDAAGTRVVDALRPLLAAAPGAALTITGHSLGSALATLLALDVVENTAFATPTAITFASPLVGNGQFAKTYDTEVPDTWRITNAVDLVPKLPPPNWGYVHVNQLYSVTSFLKAKLLPSCTHAMTTYMYLLNLANGGAGAFPLDAACSGVF